MPTDDEIYLNGIDATTGNYLIKPVSYREIASRIRAKLDEEDTSDRDPLGRSAMRWLKSVWRKISEAHLGLPWDVDGDNVKQAGWGIVFHRDETKAVKDALAPLIEHRQRQVGDADRVKTLYYESGDTRATWLARHEVGTGSIDPTKVPYYLLLVGGPEKIPFSFCHDLDVEYAVGVIHFDRVEDYAQYAASVIDYETAASIPTRREVVFFGTRHFADKATELSSQHLVKPLADGKEASANGFQSRSFVGPEATKSSLTSLLGLESSAGPPALLFTATHGLGFPTPDPQQTQSQGALLCQDWPGFGPGTPSQYFAADDLTENSRVQGMIAFCFACFSAGTPSYDRFIHEPGEEPPAITDRPFVSGLAKKLLSHPGGGALAFIGHVERAWGCSFITPGAGAQLVPFRNAIGRLLNGQPVGYAMKDFNERYASLSTSLSTMLEAISTKQAVSDSELAAVWLERNDAEGYIVIGDPAVRVRVTSATHQPD
jgi:hypothetical protein